MDFIDDDIEPVPEKYDTCEIRTPESHKIMFKALENPLRRRIVKCIGAFGKTKKEIMKEVNISESQLKFQLDFLIRECYAEVDGDNCRLNSKGIQELLANIK